MRSLTLYEPTLVSVLPAESPEGKTAREDGARIFGPAAAAAKASDAVEVARHFRICWPDNSQRGALHGR